MQILKALALLVICHQSLDASGSQSRPQGESVKYTPAEVHAIGRAVLDAQIARYGVVRNAAWRRDIDSIIEPLQRVTGYPGLRITYEVIANEEINAAAAPGGYLIITTGLMEFVIALGERNAPNNVADRRKVASGYLAAVLAHEIAHMTLGHTDSLLARISRIMPPQRAQDTTTIEPAHYAEAAASATEDLATLRRDRDEELAADRIGALYLLRAGWTIQVAMDLYRAFDSVERQSASFGELQSVTYLRSHPRASTREAMLELFRGELMLHQARLDDALVLIHHNVGLEEAIALLDLVLLDFPALIAARHARGTAYHQLWLNTVPLQTQQLRASLVTYGAHILPLVRGLPGDVALFAKARADYEQVLRSTPLSRTLSNLALLDVYQGAADVAVRRARWYSPDFADTSEKAHIESGGVSWERGEGFQPNSNERPWRSRRSRTSVWPRWPASWGSRRIY